MKLVVLSLAALGFSASATLAEMSHDGHHGDMATTDHQMDGAVHADAVINTIGDGKANVTHGPIPQIGWPAMTMDLAVLEDADIPDDIAPGDEVTLMLVKGEDGMYAIGGIAQE